MLYKPLLDLWWKEPYKVKNTSYLEPLGATSEAHTHKDRVKNQEMKPKMRLWKVSGTGVN